MYYVSDCICTYVYVCKCIYEHIHTYAYNSICIFIICVCLCLYICQSVYIYIYIIVYLPTHNSLFLQDGTHTASGVLKEAAILFNTSALASREDMAKGMTSFSF